MKCPKCGSEAKHVWSKAMGRYWQCPKCNQGWDGFGHESKLEGEKAGGGKE
jgi:ribosomal protein L37AE/L43A